MKTNNILQSLGSTSLISKQLSVFAVTFTICIFGFVLKGEWLILLSAFFKRHDIVLSQRFVQVDYNTLREILSHVMWSVVPTLLIYWAFCGFLHWYFYYIRRDNAEEWKCQPRKFLSREDLQNEILLGMLSLSIGSACSGVISWYISKGGYTTLYFDISERGWIYFLISIPCHFLFSDFLLYWAHRFFHTPWGYKHIHKYHHRYKQPTPFSFSAMHPLELLLYQSISIAPAFIVPIHYAELLIQISYNTYYGIMDHSGIKMEAIWPWQPNTTFHDNHHQYFHCNFGVSTSCFDAYFGTLRKRNIVYNENTFHGTSKALDEATSQELIDHEYNIKDDKPGQLY